MNIVINTGAAALKSTLAYVNFSGWRIMNTFTRNLYTRRIIYAQLEDIKAIIELPFYRELHVKSFTVTKQDNSIKERGNNRSKNQQATVVKWIKYLLYYSSLRRKAVHLGAISKKSRRGWRRGNVRLITNSVENPPFSPSVFFLLERFQFPRACFDSSVVSSFVQWQLVNYHQLVAIF